MALFSAIKSLFKKKYSLEGIIMSLPSALDELKRRQQDPILIQKVNEFLANDIPGYIETGTVLYLARHIATPNFETLRFVHLLEPTGYKIVVTQDSEDLFVPMNPMKKALAKLPIHVRSSQKKGKYSEQYQHVSIIDINQASGKKFKDIKTLWGQSLIDFHTELCHSFFHNKVIVADDAEWIHRNHRGDLLEHYKKFLSLFVVHGVLFEDYILSDKHEQEFIREVLHPAVAFVEQTFGYKPLITYLNPTSVESNLFWLSYPAKVLALVKEKMKQ